MSSRSSFRRKRRNSNRFRGNTKICSKREGLETKRRIETVVEEAVAGMMKEREMRAQIEDIRKLKEVGVEVEIEGNIGETLRKVNLDLLTKREGLLNINPGKRLTEDQERGQEEEINLRMSGRREVIADIKKKKEEIMTG